MILTDFSSLCIGGISEFAEDLKEGDPKKITSLIRHVTLSTLLSHKRKYSKQYGDLVIACDRPEYWRKLEFPQYKYSRKAAREESGLDWKLIYSLINEFRQELEEVFPYHVMYVENCEADDVIAVLVKYGRKTIQVGLEEELEPTIIMAPDGDFHQLHAHENVRQYNAITGKMVDIKKSEVKDKLTEKCLKGDRGDGIPNFYSADDHFVSNPEIRQKSVMAARVADFIARGHEACSNATELRNYQRNRRLIDFDEIPQWVIDKIMTAWTESKPTNNRMEILNYLQKHRCRQLIDVIEQF